ARQHRQIPQHRQSYFAKGLHQSGEAGRRLQHQERPGRDQQSEGSDRWRHAGRSGSAQLGRPIGQHARDRGAHQGDDRLHRRPQHRQTSPNMPQANQQQQQPPQAQQQQQQQQPQQPNLQDLLKGVLKKKQQQQQPQNPPPPPPQ